MGQELVGGYGSERVAGGLVPEGAEWGVEVEGAVLPQGTNGGPDREDLGQTGGVEDGVEPHLRVRFVGVQDVGGTRGLHPVGVAYRAGQCGSPDGGPSP
ncbi:hypothetical protein GCM10009647_074300 [Streptomyces sanglieri]